MSEKQNFETLVSYIKYVITLTLIWLGLISSIFAFFLWNDRKDIKNSITEIKEVAKSEIEDTKELADQEINQIKEEVNYQTRREIDKVFKTNSIQLLIERQAEYEIKENAQELINREVEKKLSQINDEMEEILLISDAASRMRNYESEGLFTLISISKNSNSENNRRLASDLSKQICIEIMRRHNTSFDPSQTDRQSNEKAKEAFEIKKLDFLQKTLIHYQNFDLMNMAQKIEEFNRAYGTNYSICDFERFKEYVLSL